jgi:GH18 family chitinase
MALWLTIPNNNTYDIIRFRVVGYYPSWEPTKTDRILYDNLTHINYAFAIPTQDASLLPLENADVAEYIINEAHLRGVQVLLSVGGWSYEGIPLEATFMAATDTPEKIAQLGDSIVDMAVEYGFDGVDVDWELPRNNYTSRKQYEGLMLYLCARLRERNMLFTSAVIGGVTPEGTVIEDAAAYTDAVLDSVDWINVMAYDGGEGSNHSPYFFAVMSAEYWRDIRKVPADKIVLGVPFYGRPNGISYAEILEIDPNSYACDMIDINGTAVYYNGIPTIQAKTWWALDNVWGIMIWELSEDYTDISRSLQEAIGNTVRSYMIWKTHEEIG